MNNTDYESIIILSNKGYILAHPSHVLSFLIEPFRKDRSIFTTRPFLKSREQHKNLFFPFIVLNKYFKMRNILWHIFNKSKRLR